MIITCYSCFSEFDDGLLVCPFCGFVRSHSIRESNHLPNGFRLHDRYIIGEVIGKGGFGIIYKALDCVLDKILVIKEYSLNGVSARVPSGTHMTIIEKKREQFEHEKQRFIEEARMLAHYSSHPNIVNVYDVFEENDTAYFAMEFLDGENVSGYLDRMYEEQNSGRPPDDARHVPMETDVVLKIINDISSGLEALHRDGIIHRDIAPDNIFLCRNGNAKLIDFGAARNGKKEDKMTKILKIGYAAPEQLTNGKQGPWTDIYAFGASLYEMVTGVRPADCQSRCGENGQDTLIPPKALNPKISEQMNNLILRAMALDPNLRYHSVAEIRSAIQQGKKVRSLDSIRLNRRIQRIAVVSLFVVLILFAGLYAKRRVMVSLNRDLNEKADIEVWYYENTLYRIVPHIKAEPNDKRNVELIPETENQMGEALSSLSEKFEELYSNVHIHLVGIRQGEEPSLLAQREQEGNLPAVFPADIENVTQYALKADEVLNGLSMMDYNEAGLLTGMAHEERRLPLGYSIPLFYVNTTLTENPGSLESSLENEAVIAFETGYRKIFEDNYQDIPYRSGTVESFWGGGANILFAGVPYYCDVKKKYAGQYVLYKMKNSDAYISPLYCYCLGKDLDPAEETAAVKYLQFLLSEYAQNEIFLTNHVPGLPMNRGTMEQYEKIYIEIRDKI